MKHYLRQFNDPILSTVCDALLPGDDLSFVAAMKRICMDNNGVGLAAPQIGVARRAVFIVPRGKGRCWTMLNPSIIETGTQKETANEGCLSYPSVMGSFVTPVERYKFIRVEFYDLNWKKRVESYSNFEARIIQHEVDHLNGVCLVGDAWRAEQGALEAYADHRRRALGGSPCH